MKEETKEQIKETVGNTAEELRDKALAAAHEATDRFWRVVLYCAATVLAGIAALCGLSSCESVQVTPDPAYAAGGSFGVARQVQAAHGLWHAATGEPCIFVVEDVKK